MPSHAHVRVLGVLVLCVAPLLHAHAAQGEPDLDIILFGATGCVGHLAAKWIAQVNSTGAPGSPPLR